MFVKKKPPTACVHTLYRKHPHVHTCAHTHMFCLQKVTLQSSSELQRSQYLHLTYLCQGCDD